MPPSNHLKSQPLNKFSFLSAGHTHRGLMALVKDYAPDVLKPVAEGLVYVLSIGTFAGLMYLNVRDVGICGAVRAVWSL
jgi:hypothetical protein